MIDAFWSHYKVKYLYFWLTDVFYVYYCENWYMPHHMYFYDLCAGQFPNIYMHNNSLAPGRFDFDFRYAIFSLILVINGWGVFCEIALRWMLLDVSHLTYDKSTLVGLVLAQVIGWANVAPDLCLDMASLCHNELKC